VTDYLFFVVRRLLVYLVIPILTVLSILNIHSQGYMANVPDETRLTPGSLAQSDAINPGGKSYADGDVNSVESTYIGTDSDKKFPFHLYVTPKNTVIMDLANTISGPEEAYQTARQWIYVSDKKLNDVADYWLTPYEFLLNTRNYPDNPLKGMSVSDCEEQANGLTSLLRAIGIQPENVRVVVGEVIFNSETLGHVWVELLVSQKWLVLDATCGPYWDDDIGILIERIGTPFDYYSNQTYPVLHTWVYYNDVYYLNAETGSGDAPVSWYHHISDEISEESSHTLRT